MITKAELLERAAVLRRQAADLRASAEAQATALEARAARMEAVLAQFGEREERLLNTWLEIAGPLGR